jgi:Glycosyl transferase family 2
LGTGLTSIPARTVPGGDVSVVVPVRDEVDKLGALLNDLRAQSYRAAELVVVDAGSTDGTRALPSYSASWVSKLTGEIAGIPASGRCR